MVSYGNMIILLIYELRIAHPHIMQLWYSDDAGTGGAFETLHDILRELVIRGPRW